MTLLTSTPEHTEAAERFILDVVDRLVGSNDHRAALEAVVSGLARTLNTKHLFLFRHDASTRLLRLELSDIEGELRWGPSADEIPLFGAPFRDDITPAWRLMVEHRSLFTPRFIHIPAHEFAWPGAMDYALTHELSDLGHIVLFAGDTPVGSIGVSYGDGRKIDVEDKAFIEQVAHQAGIVLRFADLAGRAEGAAASREREIAARQQTDALARSYSTIRGGLERMSRESTLDTMLEGLLLECIRVMGATGGSVSLWDEGRFAGFYRVAIRDRIMTRAEIDAEPFFCQAAAVLAENPDGFTSRLFNAPYTRENLDWAREHWPVAREYHERLGHREVWNVPCILHGKLIATLGLGFAEIQLEDPVLVETLISLAHQVTLVLEMIRLGKVAEQSAAELERGKAAGERAALIQRINQTLSKSTERLNDLTNERELIIEMLRTAEEVLSPLGVTGTGFVRRVPGKETHVRVEIHLHDGLDRNTQDDFWDREFPLSMDGLVRPWQRIQTEDFVWGLTGDETVLVPSVRDYHEALGGRSVAYVPLRQGNTTTGWLAFTFSSQQRPTEQQIELIRAIASQIALTIRLTELAKASETAAVLRAERSAAERRAQDLTENLAELALRDRLLTASARAMEKLSTEEDLDKAIAGALKDIGEAANVSGVKVLLERMSSSGESFHHLLYEWWAEGFPTQTSLGFTQFPTAPMAPILSSLIEVGSRWGTVDEWPSEYHSAFKAVGVRSIGVVPIYLEGEYAGVIAYDQCLTDRVWTPAEIDALTIAARGIGAALLKQKQREQAASEKILAAEQRARELIESNERLRDGLIQMSKGTEYRSQLQHVLVTACKQLQAADACVLLHEPENATLEVVASSEEQSEMLPSSTIEGRCAGPFSAAELPLWEKIVADPRPVLLDIRNDHDRGLLRPKAVQWHLEQRLCRVLVLPLVVQSRVLGCMSVSFADHVRKEHVTADAQRIGASLAALVAMMIETRRLTRREQDAAIAEEKNHLAQELHDTLAGAFTGIFMQLQAANDLPSTEVSRRDASIRKAEDLARSGLRQVREFVHTLAFSDSHPRDAVRQMREVVAAAGNEHSLKTTFTVVGRERHLKPSAAHAFQLVLREAIANAQRYAGATTLQVSLHFTTTGARVSVRDNGCGFCMEQARQVGFGLASMESRMSRAGGTLQITTAPGQGTIIAAELPDCCESEIGGARR